MGFSVTDPERRLLVVGNATRDLVDDDPRGWRLGGSVTYVSLAAARLGVPVRAVIGVDRESATALELDTLAAAGVELAPVRMPSGPIFRNRQTRRGRRQECLATGRPLASDEVPRPWRSAGAWALVPVLGEVSGDGWAALPGATTIVGVGWQGLLREAQAGGITVPRAPRSDPLLGRADLVVVSVEDLGPPRDAWRSPHAAEGLDALGWRSGQRLVITEAESGGHHFTRTSRGWEVRRYAAETVDVVDPTGAGDVFLAALLARSLEPGQADRAARLDEALHFAAVAAALATTGPGITAIPTRAEVLARLGQPAG